MGVLNVTPDSFFDGGKHFSGSDIVLDSALAAAEMMVKNGATFIDVGGESTRPGAQPVSEQQECDRVLPVVEALAGRVDAVISVDTSTPSVMVEGVKLGASLINDVRALTKPGAIQAALTTKVPLCLMHMQGKPATMQQNPAYTDVVQEVSAYLLSRISEIASFAEQRNQSLPDIVLDPGFGFGKSDKHNLTLLNKLGELKALGYPLLVGLSRKSILGRLLDREPDERLVGSVLLAFTALKKGASIVRVHDVSETNDAVRLLQHIEEYNNDT